MYSSDEGWDSWFEEYEPKYAHLLDELSIGIDVGSSDHFILHPENLNRQGERQVVWLGHDCTGFEVRGPELGMAGHFLRVLSAAIIDEPDGFIG